MQSRRESLVASVSDHRQSRATRLTRTFASAIGALPAVASLPFLLGALLFGGTSEQGTPSGFALELVSLAILSSAALFGKSLNLRRELPGVTLIAGALLLLYAMQLLPLPPGLWTALPGRGLIASGFKLLNLPPGWQPLSMSKDQTIASALALLPAACAAVLLVRMPREHVIYWAITLAAISCLSVFVGIAQLVGGDASWLQFYGSAGERASGFFANPNHLATLLLVTLPLLAAVVASPTQAEAQAPAKSRWIVYGAMTLLLGFGVLLTGSIAGAILFVPTLTASLAVVSKSAPKRSRRIRAALAVTAAVMVAALVPLGLMTLSGRTMRTHGIFGEDPLDRLGLAKATLKATHDFWPVGSGLGTYSWVYPTHEQLGQVSDVFVNHAHNEYLEILFEAGVFGLALLIVGLLWWGRRTYQAWASDDDDAPWRQAASIAIAIIIAHSSVDYPARTPAVLVVLGFCMALLDRRARTPALRPGKSFGPRTW